MTTAPPMDNSTTALFGRLWRENVRPYLKWLILALFFMALAAGAQAFSAWLMKPVVNDVFVARKEDMLIPVGAAVLAAFLIKAGATYGQAVLLAFTGQRIVTDIQVRMYDHLLGLDMGFFNRNPTGTLITRFTSDTNLVRIAVSGVLTSIGKDTLLLVGLAVVMFTTDWLLGVIAFLVIPAAVLPIARLGKRMRKVSGQTQAQVGAISTLLNQTIQGIRHVKAYGMEDHERRRMTTLVDGLFTLFYKGARVQSASSPVMEALAGVAITAVIVYGGYRVLSGATTAGDFFAFMTAALMTYEPAKRLAKLNTMMQLSLAAMTRIYDIIDAAPAIVEKPGAPALNLTGGGITFTGVDFSYDGQGAALRGLSIDVPAGKTVALVGPSGSGKTTILSLIPRFYDVNAGSVTLDGQDVRDVSIASLRGSIALVSQETALFDETVRANIAYGRQDATEEDILAAVRHAGVERFLDKLPDGLETVVGEHGAKLSGGQRQRIAIARAMVKDAPILLLDEATSALDTESERAVQTALKTLMQGRTSIVIAHRLSTVVDADLIYVIDGGQVVESGRHLDLLAAEGLYARLHAMQFTQENTPRPEDRHAVA
ncbi:MAG: ABC transporter ATP-binding protein [Magnetospiraceae bacterium]